MRFFYVEYIFFYIKKYFYPFLFVTYFSFLFFFCQAVLVFLVLRCIWLVKIYLSFHHNLRMIFLDVFDYITASSASCS